MIWRNPMTVRRLRAALAVAISLLAAAGAQAVHLSGRIISVGYPGSLSGPSGSGGQGFDYYRIGCWTPIHIELTNADGDLFNGWLEIRQADRDGDPVVSRHEISIRGPRKYFIYVPAARDINRSPFIVRVFSQDGVLTPLFNDQNEKSYQLEPEQRDLITPVPTDTRVILDISQSPLNLLTELLRTNDLSHALLVVRRSPGELPDLVAGLDMVDAIVWDAADPTVPGMAQRQALLEWTRRGGMLILGVSRTWQELGRSAFGPLLPAEIKGVASVSDSEALHEDVRDLLLGAKTATPPLAKPLSYCPVTMASLRPEASSMVPLDPQPGDTLLVTRRPYGRGTIVLVAAEIRDLIGEDSTASRTERAKPFLRQILAIRRGPAPDNSSGGRFFGELDLFGYVEQLTAFQVTASLYLLFAFAFVVAYIIAATFGSWTWLKRKALVHYAWPVFAVLTVAASATSLLAVRVVRGIGNELESFSVIDGRAGSSGVCTLNYFGLKTASHTRLDLCVPPDWTDPENSAPSHAAIRPLPPASGQSSYVATEEYSAQPISGELSDILFRATSKQFEAFWEGDLPGAGRLTAGLYRDPQGVRGGSWPRLREESWIENKLGTNLDNCYLLVATRSFWENRPRRFNEIHVYHLGRLPDGSRMSIAEVVARLKPEEEKKKPNAPVGAPQDLLNEPVEEKKPPQIRVLTNEADVWLEQVGRKRLTGYQQQYGQRPETAKLSPEAFPSAMLLLCTYDDLDTSAGEFEGVTPSLGMRLDRSLAITRDTALFVGFGEDAGPARLCWRKSGTDSRWKVIHPDESRTMYRFTVPISVPAENR